MKNDMQYQELNDEQLDQVVGGCGYCYSPSPTYTSSTSASSNNCGNGWANNGGAHSSCGNGWAHSSWGSICAPLRICCEW